MGNEAFSVAFSGKLLSIHETMASAKTSLCFGNFPGPKQIFSLSPEQDSFILEMRVEGMLYPSVLENVLQKKVLLFLAGDELKQDFDSGNLPSGVLPGSD